MGLLLGRVKLKTVEKVPVGPLLGRSPNDSSVAGLFVLMMDSIWETFQILQRFSLSEV